MRQASAHNEYRSIPILLPINQLTRYQLDGPWEMHRSILKAAQNLVEAHIDVFFDEGPWPKHGEVIDMLRLQRAFVSHAELLDCLKAPALTEITSYILGEDPNDLIHLDSFVVRSGCILRRLTFKWSPTAYISTEMLRKHPSITQFAIIVDPHDGDFATSNDTINALISHLTIPHPTASATMSPQLSEICFGCMDGSYFDFALYLKMLQSRWKADVCALKRAALLTDSEPGPDPATVRALEMLRQDGLNLSLLGQDDASRVIDHWMYATLWI